MRDMKRELRDREIQTQTQGYVSRFEPPLYVLAFTQKDFHYVNQGPSTKGSPPRNYNDTNKKYTTPTLSHIYIRGRHKAKRKYNLVITKITNNTW